METVGNSKKPKSDTSIDSSQIGCLTDYILQPNLAKESRESMSDLMMGCFSAGVNYATGD